MYSNVFISVMTLVACLHSAEIAATQTLRELAREQALKDPGVPIVKPAPPSELWPKTIEEVSKEADVVLLAKLARTNSYITADGHRVVTDYSIHEPTVIAGSLPPTWASVPGRAVPLILTVYGGEVTVEGVKVRGFDQNREAIADGGTYLLFLSKSPQLEPGRYWIYYGGIFEVSHDNVRPLLKDADNVYKGTVDLRLNDFVTRVKAGVSAIKND
jgi:hypothetical protein